MKTLKIDTALCDLRKVQEETLAAYESIEIQASVALTNARARTLLTRYPVHMDCAQIVDMEEPVAFSVANGKVTLSAADCSADHSDAADAKKYWMVNGILTIQPDAGEALRQYVGISVNGIVECPRSLSGQIPGLQVNGITAVYPDEAIRLNRTAVLDRTFLLRAKENALYWAAKRIIAVAPDLDAAALAAKGVRFDSREAILSESLAPVLVPLFEESTDLVIVPDGASVVQDDLELTDAALRRYGPKLYILGDLELTEDSAHALGQLEYLHVSGDVELPAALEEEFAALHADYKELHIIKGRKLSGMSRVQITRPMLLDAADGLFVTGCARVTLDETIEPELIRQKLTLQGCARVLCTEAQMGAVYAIANDVAHIGNDTSESSGDSPAVSNVQVVEAVQYVL
jgi:hypothetical protein